MSRHAILFPQALTQNPPPPGGLAIPRLTYGSLAVEFYPPSSLAPQQPHNPDELDVIDRGSDQFFDAAQRHAVGPRDFIFLGAGQEHRFEAFSGNRAAWAAAYGPEGGEKPRADTRKGPGAASGAAE